MDNFVKRQRLSTVSSDELQLRIEVSSNAGYGNCFNDLRFCMGAAIGLVDFHLFALWHLAFISS